MLPNTSAKWTCFRFYRFGATWLHFLLKRFFSDTFHFLHVLFLHAPCCCFGVFVVSVLFEWCGVCTLHLQPDKAGHSYAYKLYIYMININIPACDCCSLLTQQAAEMYFMAQSPGCYEYERNDGYLNVNTAALVPLQWVCSCSSVRVSGSWTFQRDPQR